MTALKGVCHDLFDLMTFLSNNYYTINFHAKSDTDIYIILQHGESFDSKIVSTVFLFYFLFSVFMTAMQNVILPYINL